MNPKVSIILPCYNVAQYIDRCVASIEAQTYTDYEVIFINDGSTDDTLDRIERYCDRENWNVYSFCNQGVAAARNEGIERAKGEYLYFCDPDDTMEPQLLETTVRKLDETGADAVHFQVYCDWEGNKEKQTPESVLSQGVNECYRGGQIATLYLPRVLGFSPSDLKRFGKKDFHKGKGGVAVWCYLYRRSVIVDNGVRFPVGATMSEDRYFNVAFLCFARKIVVIDDPLYNYYQNPNSLMSRLGNPMKTFADKICGIEQRSTLRQVYQERLAVDIFPYYAGSLVLSCMELYTKMVCAGLCSGWRKLCEYSRISEVKEAVQTLSLRGLPMKLRLPVACHKYHLGFLMFFALWVINKIKPQK